MRATVCLISIPFERLTSLGVFIIMEAIHLKDALYSRFSKVFTKVIYIKIFTRAQISFNYRLKNKSYILKTHTTFPVCKTLNSKWWWNTKGRCQKLKRLMVVIRQILIITKNYKFPYWHNFDTPLVTNYFHRLEMFCNTFLS